MLALISPENLCALSRIANQKVIFIMTSSWRHQPRFDALPEELVNRAWFGVCTLTSFEEVEANVCTFANTELCLKIRCAE